MSATVAIPAEEQSLSKILAIDGQVAYHQRQIMGLMADRSKLTSMSSSAMQIIHAVCAVHGIPEPLLMSKTRTQEVALARQMAMALVAERLSWGMSRIGRFFDRDHGTVIHAVHHVSELVAVDAPVAALWQRTCDRLDQAEAKAA